MQTARPPAAAVSIVLVGTTHPGNIGAAARAMKAMDMRNLSLVAPVRFPGAEITARAAGADDILAAADIHDSLAAAVSGCALVFATSARRRNLPWPEFDPEQAAARIIEATRRGDRAAVVFGRESSGLSNAELDLCNGMIRIPTNPEYSSLNLAAAVQVICYELFKAQGGALMSEPAPGPVTLATSAELERLYSHLEQCMVEIGYLDPENPRRLMRRIRRLFSRAQLDSNEYNILRGMLAAVQRCVRGGRDGT